MDQREVQGNVMYLFFWKTRPKQREQFHGFAQSETTARFAPAAEYHALLEHLELLCDEK
jgi:hypothetical protein